MVKIDLKTILEMIDSGSTTRNKDTIIDLILNDHNNVQTFYEKLESTSNSEEKLGFHDECEQLILYPYLRDLNNEKAERYYKESLEDHQEIRNLLYHIRYSEMNEELEKKINKAMKTIFLHFEKEERDILPLMRQEMDNNILLSAGNSFKELKYKLNVKSYIHSPTKDITAAIASVMIRPFKNVEEIMDA
ncbi:uncharacterized protein BX663DRAFT_485984 [Cokeromyces recurvatus]|uniref:uncharacterized protein n=1 Tax=Cokeromyces recurvatus TaxID=90255 RepID=UPI00221F03ED|nr:uncharacterized protein BX663DRAFT_485984 [Cokeromyces recurvatus]KAI7903249.1 hypothetical protein BX663DRAFT_485984 [Cokeromyces recurvatus]